MTSKTIFYVIIAILFVGCNQKKSEYTIWKTRNIFGYTLKVPKNYLIQYSTDSTHVEITNKNVKIDFIHGYFNVDGITAARNIRSKVLFGSVEKIICDTAENNLTSVTVLLWDTSKVSHLLGDTKYKGCNLGVDRLTDAEKDTIMKIFNSLRPGVPK